MKFIKNKTQIDNSKINSISQKFKISKDVAELLLLRGIDNDDAIEKFLNPQIANMHDPFLFKDMDIVVKKIINFSF